MADDPNLSAGEFGAAFKGFLEQAITHAPAEVPFFRRVLKEHFGERPSTLPIVAEAFADHDHPNLQVALDAYLAEGGRAFELFGVASDAKRMQGVTLGDLVSSGSAGLMGSGPPAQGPVDWVNLDAGSDEKIACVALGLYLITTPDLRLAVLVRTSQGRFSFGDDGVTVDVMSPDQAGAEAFLREIREAMRRRNVYRGKIVSLAQSSPMRALEVHFHRLPVIDRDSIVLPAGVLERVERHTVRFSELSGRLAAAGRHLKRGLLLGGPPGTGKTMTAMYLAGRMPDRTVLLLTGQTLGLIETSCAMARLLQPATVILEDVDLVAEERTRQGTGTNAVLFELLNQMDGLSEDADVLFILTTNRPELLEPALASRPGRVDEAIEIPVPDRDSRSRLLDLYGTGLNLELATREGVLDRTEGVSSAFIKELLRKAALIAADAEDADSTEELVVTDATIDQALFELVVDGGELTKAILGATPPPGTRSDC